MRCPDCHAPITWVSGADGRRVAVGLQPTPDGDHFMAPDGRLYPLPPDDLLREDVPRYALHFPCGASG